MDESKLVLIRSLISLVDEHEQWFKARCGLDLPGTSRAVSFCAYAIQSDAVFVVEDTSHFLRSLMSCSSCGLTLKPAFFAALIEVSASVIRPVSR